MPRKSDTFKDYVLEQLRSLRGVAARSMFGGFGLYRDGVFFGIVHKGRAYFKVSDKSRLEYQVRNMEPFKPSAEQTLKSFYEVPPDVIESPPLACEWAQEAVKAAEIRPAARRKT